MFCILRIAVILPCVHGSCDEHHLMKHSYVAKLASGFR